jgi:adenine-specific DNA-methyltransferase
MIKKNFILKQLLFGENIKYICGLLNSKPVTYFFRKFYAGGGLGNKV